jgi:hypothetical protein
MKTFLKHFILRTLLFILFFQVFSLGVIYILSKGNFYKPQFMQNHFVQTKLDYLILGSSTGLTTLNSYQIDSALHLKGYNSSIDDTDMSVHLMMLKEFCRVNPPPDFVVLCLNHFDLKEEKKEISSNAYRFLTIRNSPVINEYFNEKDVSFLGIFRNHYLFPFLSIAYFNKEMIFPALYSIIKPSYKNRFDENGNYSYPNMSGNQKLNASQSTSHYQIGNKKYKELVQFCKSKGIRVVVYQSPIFNHAILDDDVPDADLFVNHSQFLKDKSQFFDEIHVNDDGRFLCSKDFIQQLSSYLTDTKSEE